MGQLYTMQLNMGNVKMQNPKDDIAPISTTEKLVRKEIQKLDESAEEIKKLKEQIEKKVDDKKN